MSVLYLVVPLALLVVGVAVWAFIWAAGRGQFDDLDTPALRMLRDDGDTVPESRRVPNSTPDAPEPSRENSNTQ
jgi:cbb3-type cytochrome oxidase maturation protein